MSGSRPAAAGSAAPTHAPPPERAFLGALAAARAAARAIAAVGDPTSLAAGSVVQKGAAGPATVADLASQAAIVLALRAAHGRDVPIVAEESLEEAESLGGHSLLERVAAALGSSGMDVGVAGVRDALSGAAGAGGAGSFWTVDPLDGTKGYLRGGQFAVAIAHVEGGRPALGVLLAPRLASRGLAAGEGIMAVAVAGGGAWQSAVDRWEPARIGAHPWRAGDPVRVAGSVEKAHSSSDSLESRIASLGRVEPVRIDSQAKYALVARGDADCYVRLSPSSDYRECIWDHAAGALVASEAGARVTDASGRMLDFSQGRRFRDAQGIVCASPPLHAAVLDVLRG